MLKLSDNLSLPLDAVTQTFGILAVRGAGKSNTAAVMAEEMFRSKLPFVVVDPVGAWWGLRSSSDGHGPGLAIPVFGGRHGDVPLEKGGGHLIADLVVDDRLSCVLDCSEFSEGDKIQFLINFSERLYRRNQDPLHLFLEEADDYAPQRPFREQARLLRAWENVVRRGRARGLGITMITQRSAALNKNVLTQIETLIVLRTTAPNDRKAIAAWVEYHGQGKELLDSLPTLRAGEAWVWSPSWLHALRRVQIHRRVTFDSGATPKDVHGKRPPTTLADVNLAGITRRMEATIERAKADDPRELKRRIAELEREIKTRPAAPPPERIEVPVMSEPEFAKLEGLQQLIVRHADEVLAVAKEIRDTEKLIFLGVSQKPHFVSQNRPFVSGNGRGVSGKPGIVSTEPKRRDKSLPGGSKYQERLPVGERRVLTAIVQHGFVQRDQLSVLTGYRRSSRDAYLQRLKEKVLIEFTNNGIEPTRDGVLCLGTDFEPLPSGDALRQYWFEHLPIGEKRILAEIVAVYPKSINRENLSDNTEYKRSSRDAYLQRLQSRRLVESKARGEVRASKDLFDE